MLTVIAVGFGQTGTSSNSRFPCIQKGFSTEDIVRIGANGDRDLTVRKRLSQLNARCRGGKLVTPAGRQIRFYRTACWGNPPADYLEILDRQKKELAQLKKKYTVIEIACDPRAVV